MEYSKGRSYNPVNEIKQDYSPVSYAILKINNPDGTIRYGTFDLEFYKPPVNLTNRSPIDLQKH